MKNQTYKLNEHGNIDIDYYTKLASEQRSEHIAHMAASLTAKIKALFRKFAFQVKLPKLATGH